MKNIREFLTVIFRDLGAQTLIEQGYEQSISAMKGVQDHTEYTEYDHLNTDVVFNLMEERLKHYSRSELEMLLSYLLRQCAVMKDMFKEKRIYQIEEQGGSGFDEKPIERGSLNVFVLLTLYALQLINDRKDGITVKYDKLLHWKDASYVISEDVLISAAIAGIDRNIRNKKQFAVRDLNWPSVLGTDVVYGIPSDKNKDNVTMQQKLREIMEKGLAENHYHLKGSGPSFLLTWEYLMNHFGTKDEDEIQKAANALNYDKELRNTDYWLVKEIEERSRNSSYHVSAQQSDAAFLQQLYQAAAIRFFLFNRLQEIEEGVRKYHYTSENCSNWGANHNALYVFLKKCSEIEVDFSNPKSWKRDERKDVFEDIARFHEKIHDEIQRVKDSYSQEDMDAADYDYAFSYYDGGVRAKKQTRLYAGERFFLYRCFCASEERKRTDKVFTDEDKQLFLIYLMIHERLRIEFHQVNRELSGFENFDIHELRKNVFLKHNDYATKKLLELTFKENFDIPGMKKLEARISPKESAILKRRIEEYESSLKMLGRQDDVGFVLHFIKRTDEYLNNMRIAVANKEKNISDFQIEYRNANVRDKLEKSVQELIDFRESGFEYADRVVGIDACNFELFCRPEVFAPSFQTLKMHRASKVPDLRVTYHVGEGFLDIVNGLRAVDEAVEFLELRTGDRLGHALALGVDPDLWYKKKYRLMLPMQEHLDNIVWLYFQIKGTQMQEEREALLKEFRCYFDKLFQKAYNSQKNVIIPKTAGLDSAELIEIYYKSWRLRKEDPICYLDKAVEIYSVKKVKKPKERAKKAKLLRERGVKMVNPKSEDLAVLLNTVYHYDNYIKIRGLEPIEIDFSMNADYIRLVKLVQRNMQFKIRDKGIAIESNPTSNYLIGTFNRYDQHPILRWNDTGLSGQDSGSPKLMVSINTDDAGVFITRLDNEYALMARALQKVTEKEKRKYTDQQILSWIDKVRQMGMDQSWIK